MLELFVFVIVTVIIEITILSVQKNKQEPVEEDPMALPYKARRVEEPEFNYIPGRQTYDDKSRRYVIDWKYAWEYQGKKHSIMVCNNPNSQYEHYMPTFPDEINITIHKETGKYYISKVQKAQSRRSLWTLLISMLLGWVITNMLIR
ncbi:MAG: hypothetical protein IIY53_05865 [Solobacterium sp.]|nr:hypothetical protein [Solobacterium sp.]